MLKKLFAVGATLITLVLFITMATPKLVSAQEPGPVSSADLQEWVSGIVDRDLENLHIPGAVVVAVNDSSIIFEQGYGLADVEKNLAVDPERTLFRIGSISKTFAGTAVMQLVEAGRLDLDADINTYLKTFKVPEKYGQPITTANLLTHTAGFDERFTGMESASYKDVPPLGKYLASSLPEIVRRPGEASSYSNHGLALAGYLVEEISGEPYEQYVTDHILEPLGMTNTRPRITEDVIPNLAFEYAYRDGSFKPMRLYDYNVFPAGSVVATAADMSKYMIAHLNGGANGSTRILGEAAVENMHARHFGGVDGMEGMAYVFYERYHGGHRFVVHGGDTSGTHSFMLLDPESKFGFFISTNGEHGEQLVADVIEGFWDRYFPEYIIAPAPVNQEDAARVAGTYRNIRYPRTTFGKIIVLLQPPTVVTAMADGKIHVVRGKSTDYLSPLGDLKFRSAAGADLGFMTDDQGNVTYMVDEVPIAFNEPTAWYDLPVVHIGILGVGGLTFILILALGLFGLRKRDGRETHPNRFGWLFARLTAVVNLAALVLVVLALVTADSSADVVFFPSPALFAGLIMFAAGALLAVATAVYTVYALITRRGPVRSRVGLAYVSAAAFAFALVLNYYNMVGVRW